MLRPEVAIRFKAALEASDINQSDLARVANCSRSFVNKVARGVQAPSLELLDVLTERYDVSASWILCGVGPMMLGDLKVKSVKEAAADVAAAADAVLEAAALLGVPLPLPASIEAQWGERVDAVLDAAMADLRKDVLECIQVASAGNGRERQPIYRLVDQLVAECPDQVATAETIIDALVRRCTEAERKTA